jgi:hypothetical protein
LTPTQEKTHGLGSRRHPAGVERSSGPRGAPRRAAAVAAARQPRGHHRAGGAVGGHGHLGAGVSIDDGLYQFSPNTPALAAEVNSNFATIRQLAADNQAALATKLDKSGGIVNGNLDVNGVFEVGTSNSTALRMFNDSDIVGADIIQGFNDIHLQGDGAGGTDLLIRADGEVNVKGNLRVEGTIVFNRQSCRTVTGGGGRHYCADGEFMNGLDHNVDNDGNIQCCKF